jgi:hypothetical protein
MNKCPAAFPPHKRGIRITGGIESYAQFQRANNSSGNSRKMELLVETVSLLTGLEGRQKSAHIAPLIRNPLNALSNMILGNTLTIQ